jgi:hypothetical protein
MQTWLGQPRLPTMRKATVRQTRRGRSDRCCSVQIAAAVGTGFLWSEGMCPTILCEEWQCRNTLGTGPDVSRHKSLEESCCCFVSASNLPARSHIHFSSASEDVEGILVGAYVIRLACLHEHILDNSIVRIFRHRCDSGL